MTFDLRRRLQQLVSRVRLTTIDDTGNTQKVQAIGGVPGEVIDKVRRMAEYGFTSVPPAGSDAVVMFVDGERSNGIVIATNNQTFRLKNLANGDVALYDSRGRVFKFTATGVDLNAGGGLVNVHNASSVLVDATGDIVASGSGRTIVNTAEAFFNCPVTFTQLATFSGGIMADGKDIGGMHQHSGGTIGGHTGGPL